VLSRIGSISKRVGGRHARADAHGKGDDRKGGRLGLSGRIAERFQNTEITPLLAIAGLLLTLFASWAYGSFLSSVPEVADYEVYAGTAAPINFNGLVRQYYLREGPHLGDIQVNLVDKHYRDDKSHKIALRLREPL
jgi:hypothetical protein